MITTHEQSTGSGFSIGWLTLDLPRTLNALTLEMCVPALQQLQHWAQRPDIACIVLQGNGRAFCAGGDVRRMRQGILANDDYCERFFEQEYRLDYALHRFPKPVLVWGHGIVMGGGLGLFMGCSHRVVTPSTQMAMPEINIGLYPDVGATRFLNELPEGLGLFLGITGCQWNAADAIALGMAHHLLHDEYKEQLPSMLESLAWCEDSHHNHQLLTAHLQQLPPAAVDPSLTTETASISQACRGELPEVLTALQQLAIPHPWFTQAMHNLLHGCPVTPWIVVEQLRRGKYLSLADAFRLEWCLSIQCTQHADFPEGVRAQLVDKDRQPRWQFAAITAVPANYIAQHFTPPDRPNPLENLA